MTDKIRKLMLLGGINYLIPVIKTAHEIGLYVITCDYTPDNIAHKYSDEYHNVNIVDKEAVLELANKLNIDGIMSFAVDPGVITAAYVAEKLGLPGCPYKSVKILQNKDQFREFLKINDFNVPLARSYDYSDISKIRYTHFNFPVIVKPIDSAGSKGVAKVNCREELRYAIENAFSFSFSKKIIIEDFIEKKGYSSDTDCFSIDGELSFYSFSNQYFDDKASNPYTPSAYSWPSSISLQAQKELIGEMQRLITLLKLGTSIYNVEVREGSDDKPYIMEFSPRGGGNRLSELLKYATGIDLIKNSILAAIGDNLMQVEQRDYNGYWAEIILHSNKSGNFKNLKIDPVVKKNFLVELDLWIEVGDFINEFKAANDTIGTIILKFDSQKQLENYIYNQECWLEVIVDET